MAGCSTMGFGTCCLAFAHRRAIALLVRIHHGVVVRVLRISGRCPQRHVQARRVHHREHRLQAAVGSPTSQPGGAVEGHHAGGAAVMPIFFFDAIAAQRMRFRREGTSARGTARCPGAGGASGSVPAPGARCCPVGPARRAGDEDLRALRRYEPSACRRGARGEQAQVGAGMRLRSGTWSRATAAHHLFDV